MVRAKNSRKVCRIDYKDLFFELGTLGGSDAQKTLALFLKLKYMYINLFYILLLKFSYYDELQWLTLHTM